LLRLPGFFNLKLSSKKRAWSNLGSLVSAGALEDDQLKGKLGRPVISEIGVLPTFSAQ
jgi:hypothetical protein